MTPNPAVQGTLRDKASRSVPDLERSASSFHRFGRLGVEHLAPESRFFRSSAAVTL